VRSSINDKLTDGSSALGVYPDNGTSEISVKADELLTLYPQKVRAGAGPTLNAVVDAPKSAGQRGTG
jgi:hypothetical protein